MAFPVASTAVIYRRVAPITLPFFWLPSWCFLGRGFDSLRARLNLNWPVALLGTLLFFFFVVFFCGFRFELSPDDRIGASWT
jgi:hypothetical protein